MRYQGKIKSWNEAKGFGFISPNGGGKDIFVHISQFKHKRTKLNINTLVIYEIELDKTKRQSAIKVEFVENKINTRTITISSFSILIFYCLTLTAIIFLMYNLYQHRGSTIQSSFYKSINERDYQKSEFSCNGKTRCSEMSSCKEALFYQENCPNTEMDGNNDGIPCEQQWCN